MVLPPKLRARLKAPFVHHRQSRTGFEIHIGGSALSAGTGLYARGCAKTPTFNLRVENPSRFSQSENQKCWRRLSEEANRENVFAFTRLAHVFPQPGPNAIIDGRDTFVIPRGSEHTAALG